MMENKSGKVFIHSVKVPTQYKRIASIFKASLEQKKSLKTLIFQEKHGRTQGMQAILKQYSDNREAIEKAIRESKILEDNPRLCPILCKVLVTELLLGRKQLIGESKPVQTVKKYREALSKALGGKESEKPHTTVSKPRYVRINTNLISLSKAITLVEKEGFHEKECPPFETYNDYVNAIASLSPEEYLKDINVDNLLVFSSKVRQYWAVHKLVQRKKFLLQDKGTCLVAEILQPPAGSIVLDMCAAPGMKTIHISNVMNNQGKIYAIEKNPERYQLLCQMIHTAGCGDMVECFQADALEIDDSVCPGVEYILLDPPCSGSGMQNRIAIESEQKNSERLHKLGGLQITMLAHAMNAFPSVKRICYSTCSLYEEENEHVVERCLQLNPNFKLLSCRKALRSKWAQTANSKCKNIEKCCIYTRPDKDLTDGIFIAFFERKVNRE